MSRSSSWFCARVLGGTERETRNPISSRGDCEGSRCPYLKGKHIFLQEQVCSRENRSLHAILGTTLCTGQASYPLRSGVVMGKRLHESFAGCRGFGSRSFIIAKSKGDKRPIDE